MIDYSKLNYISSKNTFKNTGVFSTSISLSGNIAPGTEVQFTSTINLTENQVFVFARAFYTEYVKGGSATWQIFPSFDVNVPTNPVGLLSGYLLARVNGTQVQFIAGIFNPYFAPETITPMSIPISYVTYTLAR